MLPHAVWQCTSVQPNCRRRLCRRRYICVTIMKIGWGEGTMRNFPVDRIRPFLMVNDGKKVAANRVITNTLCCTYFKIVLYGEVEVPHTHQLCICHQSFEEAYRSWLCRWNLGNGNRLLRGIVRSKWTAVLNCKEAKVVVFFLFICWSFSPSFASQAKIFFREKIKPDASYILLQ